jgi:hypothetical protein
MKEGEGGGEAHYCIKRGSVSAGGTYPDGGSATYSYYVAIRNTCAKEVVVSACGRNDLPNPKNEFRGKWSCHGGRLKPNDYVDPKTFGWVCADVGCDGWTFVWNAEFGDSGIRPKSPVKNQATSAQ